jgi:hypothetical protein
MKLMAVALPVFFTSESSAVVKNNNYATSKSDFSYAQARENRAPVRDETVGTYASFAVMKGFAGWTEKYSIKTYDSVNGVQTETEQDELNYSPFGISGAFGFFSKNFRGELEFNYVFPFSDKYMDVANDEFHSLDFGNYSFMANAYWDFGTRKWAVRPYIGAGVGLNIAQIERAARGTYYDSLNDITITSAIVRESRSFSRLSAQGMAGLYGEVGKGVFVDLGYRLVMNGSAEMEQPIIYTTTVGAGAPTEVAGKLKTNFVSDPAHFLRLGLRFEI